MTREEAIEMLKREKEIMCYGCMHPQMIGWCENHCQMPEAIDMAIEALNDMAERKDKTHTELVNDSPILVKDLVDDEFNPYDEGYAERMVKHE